jgi:DNA-binding response OmpR family regulator
MQRLYALVITAKQAPVRQYTEALQGAGYAVQVVTTGSRAQVQLTFTNPDLIVLDLDLPDMSGEVILRQIIAQPRLHSSGLIVLSHKGDASRNKSRRDLQVITKPVQSRRLADLAAQAADIRA